MQTVAEIKKRLLKVYDLNDSFLLKCQKDERKSVQALVKSCRKKIISKEKLKKNFLQMQEFENNLKQRGINVIAGVDEVGRGCLAGPVLACAVILPNNFCLYGLNDSKKLTKNQREVFATYIKEHALSVGIGILSPEEIDQVNIYEASKLAMCQAVETLMIKPEFLLVDAITLAIDYKQQAIVKGDLRSVSIAAASVVAKVTRDNLMHDYDKVYPGYGFSQNMGYGTPAHLKALKQNGVTKIHRKTFAPVTTFL